MGLKALREADRRRVIPGARAHRYQLKPKLGEAEVAEIEAAWEFRAPDDYRAFLLEAGNGGAGPGGGVYQFGKYAAGEGGVVPWDDSVVGTVSAPFAFREAWNEPPALEESSSEALAHRTDWRWDELRRYFVDATNGAIPIGRTGQDFERIWLVVTGPEAGTVWLDRRTRLQGLAPVLHPHTGAKMIFSDWYMLWVTTSLEALRRGAA